MRSVLGRLAALHAPGGTAGAVEYVVAELLLGQEVPAVDHLVEERAGCAARPAEDVRALVAVLVAGGVVPAGFRVRIGDRLIDLVACGADLGVGVGVTVRRLDHGEPGVATAREPDWRLVDRVDHVRVHGAGRGLVVVRAVRRGRLVVDRAGLPAVSRSSGRAGSRTRRPWAGTARRCD